MTDQQHCPACGALNHCSLADPRRAPQACWCYGVTIDPSVLQALPAALRDKTCLCPRCAAVEDQLQSRPSS
ncbi:cysteine-rich CWC family protein [Pseudomonas juntendi]|uniref:Cysteine-rich CWC family protein n=1 Tax=Pseudomonas juntendi TaxID=2666183 RepID=A0ABZ2JDY0_9PSED|nr:MULTISPECIES: cysteine-rich CWC family protein [Pseudomonas]MDG9873865.1 cysteine-rich CWC family protein [Pseudomonas juntendi]MDH2013939.1 cysteine-rich CWC family protein [Pseudomonas juntendi]QDR69817.1 cysteine-rich CWC family protein [Pseudomonas sp. BJP69]